MLYLGVGIRLGMKHLCVCASVFMSLELLVCSKFLTIFLQLWGEEMIEHIEKPLIIHAFIYPSTAYQATILEFGNHCSSDHF